MTGSGAPDASLGSEGDSYIDTSTFDYYLKTSSGWAKSGNLKGAAGQDGEDGRDGNDGNDGVSISGVSKTSSDGSIDTYTITYSDGSTSTFTVTNGSDGARGIQGEPGEDGHTPVITIGSNGNWFVDGVDSGCPARGDKGEKGDKGDKGDAGKDGKDGKDAITYVPCIFNNWDGTKLYEFYFEKGTDAVYGGATPTKEDTTVDGHTAHWTFKDWDKPLENILQPTIFTAQFESLVNVTFRNYDGTALESKSVNFGETPTYEGDTPVKPSSVDGSTTIEWTFKGWDKALGPVYEDAVYTAVFDSPNAIKCTFLDEDGSLLGYSYCGKGGKAVYSGERPTKAEANDDGVITRYAFSGWDKAATNIQSDTVFTAKYDESTYYACRFVDWDGTLLKEVIVPENGIASYGSTPKRDPVSDGDSVTEYAFSSWSPSTFSIAAPTTFTAVYDANTYEGYIVTINGPDGSKLALAPVAKGATDFYPNSISEVVDECYSYDSEDVTMFVGWDDSLENVTSAKTVTARTKTISRHQNGEYPQTPVTDSNLISVLNELTSTDVQGYYEYGGEKYANADGAWRKVEPIKWRYLRSVSEGAAEFISDRILATRAWNGSVSYHEDGAYANNYEKSDIRKWLNGDFMDQAFYYDRSLVQSAAVDNGASTTENLTNQYACGDTTDYIYLPSYKDVTNGSYGFGSDADRVAYDIDGYASDWWTRSPSPDRPGRASYVSSGGNVRDGSVVYDGDGVRPCIQLSVA